MRINPLDTMNASQSIVPIVSLRGGDTDNDPKMDLSTCI